MANVVNSPVESLTFQDNISKIFTETYDENIAEKAAAAYKMYIESKSDEFEQIKEDVVGHDDDPTKSHLYKAILEGLQTETQFVSDEDKQELYNTLLAAVDGVIISFNQPWNLENHKKTKKTGSVKKDQIRLQSIHYAEPEVETEDIDDEKYQDSSKDSKPNNCNDAEEEEEDPEALSDLEN